MSKSDASKREVLAMNTQQSGFYCVTIVDVGAPVGFFSGTVKLTVVLVRIL
jgi:hypothetical protein